MHAAAWCLVPGAWGHAMFQFGISKSVQNEANVEYHNSLQWPWGRLEVGGAALRRGGLGFECPEEATSGLAALLTALWSYVLLGPFLDPWSVSACVDVNWVWSLCAAFG